MPYTLKQVTEAVGVARSRAEQWISRGYFRAPERPSLAGLARDWDLVEVMRLALCVRLVDSALGPEEAGRLTWSGLDGFSDDVAFYVAWQGTYPDQDPSEVIPGRWICDIIRGRELAVFLAGEHVDLAITVNLDKMKRDVSESLKSLGN